MKKQNSLWLIGAGEMAKNYAVVLKSLKHMSQTDRDN